MARSTPEVSNMDVLADGIKSALEREGISLTRDQALALATDKRGNLVQSLLSSQSGGDRTQDLQRINKKLDSVKGETVKKTSFLGGIKKFVWNHPILTTLGIGAAAYFGTPYLFKAFGAAEGAATETVMNWFQNFFRATRGVAAPGLPGGSVGGATNAYGMMPGGG